MLGAVPDVVPPAGDEDDTCAVDVTGVALAVASMRRPSCKETSCCVGADDTDAAAVSTVLLRHDDQL